MNKPLKRQKLTLDGGIELPFSYDEESFTVELTTYNLCKMFWAHKRLRQQKTGFKNPLWICLLRKFIFEYLPEQTATLWKNVASIEHGLEVVALQAPWEITSGSAASLTEKYFPRRGMLLLPLTSTILLNCSSTYLARRKQWAKKLPDDKGAAYLANQRSFVVIDSIKNPFESMYLKSRYTNYYLIGTYTEDRTRHERLREKECYPRHSY
ncbi:MAG: hypothetical protein V8S32_02240 [Lachnospiraceae bacterium]